MFKKSYVKSWEGEYKLKTWKLTSSNKRDKVLFVPFGSERKAEAVLMAVTN